MAEYSELETLKSSGCDSGNTIRTHFAEIIVRCIADKPYYEILYFDTEDRSYHIGFGSYCLEYVFKWLSEEFEIVADWKTAGFDPVVHGRWENANNRPKTYERRCTACGGIAYFCGKGCSYKFCPNCGAKMEGQCMTYEENKKLIDAANLLKEHCEKNFREKECDCPFDFGDDGICSIGDLCPDAWEVPKPNRWTPEDVALAKALKAVRVTEIYGSISHYRTWKDENMNTGYLPSAAFRNMDYQETVKIDDIIKEAEEDI